MNEQMRLTHERYLELKRQAEGAVYPLARYLR